MQKHPDIGYAAHGAGELEPPEGRVIAYCRKCGVEIYEGDNLHGVDYDYPLHDECEEAET